MRKKLKNRLRAVESPKLKVESLKFKVPPTFSFQPSAFSLVLLLVIACSSKEGAHEHSDTYICPMHPTVVSDKPGVCPVCGMDLVRKARPGEEVKITEDLARLIKSPNEAVVASIRTMRAEYKSMPLNLSLKGVVTYDTRNIYTIPARVGGRLEKVLLKYDFQPVRKGQRVAEIYSPEMVNAQREFLYLMKNDPDNQPMLDAAKSKLLLLGATNSQVEELALKNEVAYTFSIYSPHDGFVISENLSAPTVPTNGLIKPASNSGGMGMGGSSGSQSQTSSSASASSSSFVREGSYVTAGQTLFRIVNLQSLWIEFNIPLSSAVQIKKGDIITWQNGLVTKQSKVDFVEPFFDEGEDFVKVRSYYKGADVTVGQLVDATIQTSSGESLWIPKDALLDLGLHQVIFIKERGSFKPKKVTAGLRSGDWIQIIHGLTSSDEFASQAQYLVDSENFIKTTN